MAEGLPPWRSFWQPAAEPAPPPPPASAAAPRGRASARAAETAVALARLRKPPGGVGLPKHFEGVLSVGSVGHPYTCREPCKYVRKIRGCKDGADCDRCHAGGCTSFAWRRSA